MAPTAPSHPNPQCSCSPNPSTQSPDHLSANIKITHPADSPPQNTTPKPKENTITPSTSAQQCTTTMHSPSAIHTTLSTLSTQQTTLTRLTSHIQRLEAAQQSHRDALEQTLRKLAGASKKQHERLMGKVVGVESILTCVHEEFHGERGEEGRRMCERVDEIGEGVDETREGVLGSKMALAALLRMWEWHGKRVMGVQERMGGLEEKVERMLGMLAMKGGNDSEEDGRVE